MKKEVPREEIQLDYKVQRHVKLNILLWTNACVKP